MSRPILLAALLGGASTARINKRRAHSAATSYIGEVPVFNEGSTSERFNVYFSPKATDAMLEEFCAGNCEFRGHPDAGGVAFVVMKDEGIMQGKVSAYQSAVTAVEKDGEMVDDDMSEGEVAAASWGVTRVGGGSSGGRNGAGVNIYVLDSGVRVTHQDFGGRAIPTLDANTLPPTECASDDTSCASDGRGHGSHVAGSAAGTTFGVAPAATIRAMNRGSGYADAFAAMDWLALNHIKPAVLTMSFGSDNQVAGAAVALDAVVNRGVPVTVSAGNSDIDSCVKTWSFVRSSIGVGSSTSRDERSSFSNWGDCVTLFAPGSGITSASHTSDTGSSSKSGTSMATPHVAGGVALLLQEDPSLLPAKVKQRLIDNAEVGVLVDLKGSPNLLLNIREPYTGPPTPAPPTPAPGTWELSGTGCEMDGNCISSKNHPSNYGNDENCRIDLYGDIPLTTEAFSTESRYDSLTVGGVAYSGNSGPPSGSYSGAISWNSDFSVTNSGWRLCRTDQSVAVAEEAKPASVIGGILIPIAEELAAKLAQALADYTVDWIRELASAPSVQVSQPAIDAVWISQVNGTWGTWSGQVISAYYHPSRDHSATTDGKLGAKRSVAAAGHWAVSAQTRAMWGNEAFYDTL